MARTKTNQTKEEVPAPKRISKKSRKELADEESSAEPASKKARNQPKEDQLTAWVDQKGHVDKKPRLEKKSSSDSGPPLKAIQDQPGSESEKETVDPGKSTKFRKMLKDGQLPESIMRLHDVEAKNQLNPRAFKTSIINNVLAKQPDGSFKLCMQNAKIQGYIESTEKKSGHRSSQGMQKHTFIASIFNGNMDLFQQALNAGEITIKEDEGKEYYTIKSIGSTHEKGTYEKILLNSAHRVDGSEAVNLIKAMKSEAGLAFITVDKKAEEILAEGKKIPEQLETALNTALEGMKREVKAFAVLISCNPRETHRDDCFCTTCR